MVAEYFVDNDQICLPVFGSKRKVHIMLKSTALLGLISVLASQLMVGCSGDHSAHTAHDAALKLGIASTAPDSMSSETDSMNMAAGSIMSGGMMESGMMGNSADTTCAQEMPAMHNLMHDDAGMMGGDSMGIEADSGVPQIDSSVASGAQSEPATANSHAAHH